MSVWGTAVPPEPGRGDRLSPWGPGAGRGSPAPLPEDSAVPTRQGLISGAHCSPHLQSEPMAMSDNSPWILSVPGPPQSHESDAPSGCSKAHVCTCVDTSVRAHVYTPACYLWESTGPQKAPTAPRLRGPREVVSSLAAPCGVAGLEPGRPVRPQVPGWGRHQGGPCPALLF